MNSAPAGAERLRTLHTDLIAVALCAIATSLVFAQTQHFAFLNFDDPGYVTRNPEVLRGLDAQSIQWAFTTFSEGHYHPLTWLSHMAVVQMLGASARAAHLVNVALHALNAALLYLLFARTTGQRVQACIAALLFAVHPLRAESVAWVTERKDVLSTTFWLAALLCYVRWVHVGGVLRWAGTLLCFALGLLAKPMLVTLPATLLLLDHWPLGRVSVASFAMWRRDVVKPLLEKVPFLALSLASALATCLAQQQVGAMLDRSQHALGARLANAFTSYLAYVGQWCWPAELSIFHPLRPIPPGVGIGAALAVVGLSIAQIRVRKRALPLAVGWFWYLVTLLPVIGFVQVGGQARADRFTYVPAIGLGILLVWGVPALLCDARWLTVRRQLAAVSCALAALAFWAHVQTAKFRDSEAIWLQALSVDPDNFMAHNNLGAALDAEARFAESEPHFREAVRLNPTYPPARTNLGNALARRGDYGAALEQFALALERQPGLSEAHYNLGLTLARLGRYDEAAQRYRAALAITPTDAMAHFSFGALLVGRGRVDEGVSHLQRAAALQPRWGEPRAMLDRLHSAP